MGVAQEGMEVQEEAAHVSTFFWANAPCTQHNFEISENTLYSGIENNAFWKNKSRDFCVLDIKIWKKKTQNPIMDKKIQNLKIIHFGKFYPEEIIVFWKRGSGI